MSDAEITAERLHAFGVLAAETLADPLETAAVRFGIDTPLRVAHFIAQAAHESGGFRYSIEHLDYSPERLMQVWPARFPSLAAAAPYGHNPEKLANQVYGLRMGNTQPGDGFRFRGRGYFQLTGRANYARAGAALGLDLIGEPDLLSAPAGAALSAAWFWSDRGLNALADADDIAAITRRINGGLVGLSGRQALLARAKTIWA